MTDTRLTQAAVEQWINVNTPAQVTQVAIEHWATAASGSLQLVATQLALEQWASVAAAAVGGGPQARVMVMA